MTDENPITLVTTKGDAEIAADLKKRLAEALLPVMLLFDEAARHGMTAGWTGIAPNQFLKHEIVGLKITKTLA